MSCREENGGVVHLSSSSARSSSVALSTQRVHRAPVSCRTAEDVRQHIFYVVWVCGMPVHVRYVAQLLQRGAVASSAAATVDFTAMAQHAVFRPVYERGSCVQAALAAWPGTVDPPLLSSASSTLVPLGVEDVPHTAPMSCASGSTTISFGTRCATGERNKGADDNKDEGGEAPAAAAAAAALQHDPSSPSGAAVRPVAVVPAPHFSNVVALALYSPSEGHTTSISRSKGSLVDPDWCARAYWTAARHAQQWLAHHTLGDAAESRVREPRSNALLRCTLVPASSPARKERRGTQSHDAAAAAAAVVIDADDDAIEVQEGGVARVAVPAVTRRRARSAVADDEVIVIDSDDD